ncbi:MAG: hypothetical protein A2551_06905 [Elusimicrobia bacterium RIFOXYD2_FULL_34_30]|nr:MAG: hypothetical protein A2551_06905 [Elusimicrobia bacterium RIFOXYD2_FULL_34_30]
MLFWIFLLNNLSLLYLLELEKVSFVLHFLSYKVKIQASTERLRGVFLNIVSRENGVNNLEDNSEIVDAE